MLKKAAYCTFLIPGAPSAERRRPSLTSRARAEAKTRPVPIEAQ
jgi:hypothetical protein